MTRMEYGKLVRDRIPEIITGGEGSCETRQLSEAQFGEALREKLVEESREAAAAPPDQLTVELADLYEVIDALTALSGIEEQAVREEQARRHAQRGGFVNRLLLVWSE